ncbi:MAG TPA: hypothetical protein VHM23_00130 [Actinomycetota bacterium]|jgi:hypothetical protein|nr:hypothetical protein [Actinomycetota bacterium]
MLRAAEAIRTELDDGHGLIRRYRNDDHLAGPQGLSHLWHIAAAVALARP